MTPNAAGWLAALVAPPRCGACGRECAPVARLCPGCERELNAAAPLIEPGPPGIELAVAASRFEGVARELVHGLKYGRRLAIAECAAAAMIEACPPAHRPGTVVPVPAAPWRRRWRGFDPAEELALGIARLGGLDYRPCLRRDHGPRQVGRPRAQRLAEPPRAWTAGSVPAEALLVDDVCTTGATLVACASALRSGGCERVVALTLARVVQPPKNVLARRTGWA